MQNKAANKMADIARDVDLCLYNVLTDYMPKEIMIDAISLYLTSDGGFGNGLYIDNYPKKHYTFISLVSIVISLILYINQNKFYLLFFILSIILHLIGIVLNNILEKYKKILSIIRNR